MVFFVDILSRGGWGTGGGLGLFIIIMDWFGLKDWGGVGVHGLRGWGWWSRDREKGVLIPYHE